MATIALAVVASQINGSAAFIAFTTAALATAGGIIDSAFVFPAIFGTPNAGNIEGPRLSSLSPQDSSEGVGLNRCFGSRVRVGGNVIWMQDLEEVASTSGGGGGGKGGGGGGGGSQTTYEYYANAMIAICEGEIEGIVKIYADGKTFFNEASPGTLSNTKTATVTDLIQMEVGLPNNYYGPVQLYKAGGGATFFTDLGFVGSGEVTIDGYTDTDNNATVEVKNVREKITGDESITLKTTPSGASSLEESVTITQEVVRHPSTVDRVAIYPGATNDTIDPLVEGAELTANTPRFKNVAKMVVERLALADYGNRLPQFNFVVNMQNPTTVRSAIGDILERGGLSAGDYDVTGIDASYELTGYSIAGSKSVAATLEPIMLVWNLAVYEDNGVLVFYERGNETILSDIRTGDWTAHVHGTQPEKTLIISEKPTFDLPSEVTVGYIDEGSQDQVGEARARRIDFVSDINENIRIPIVMSAGLARAVAETRLWRAANDKRKASFKLPPRFMQVTEGDIVPTEIDGETYNVRLTRVSRGNNYLIDCEGIVQDNTEFDFTQDGEVIGDDTDDDVNLTSDLLLLVWNSAPLSDEHILTAGYYWAFCLMSPTATFSGGSLYRSDTDAGTYSVLDSAPEASIFFCETQLADTPNPNLIDNINTLDVNMVNGTLSSVNEIDLLNGANRAVLENEEIIGFQTATSIGTNRYRLSGLLRGLRGSERFTSTHPSEGELGVVLDSSTVKFQSHNLGDIGSTKYHKPVAVGQVVDDIDEQAFTLAGCTIKPMSVVNIEATRNGSNDVTLTWDRRSRALYRELTATIPPPLVDGVESYEIDLLNPAGSEVIQTFSVSAETATITNAEIVAAGYGSGDPIKVEVFQTSPTVGRGIVKEATV